MTLYHTSYTIIQHPEIKYSRDLLDFGKGFYLTSTQKQAEFYGERLKKRYDKAFLNVFELDEKIKNCKYKKFKNYNNNWLDFVVSCRKGLSEKHYDIIEGGIANDQVFNTVDLYLNGIYSKRQALDKLRFETVNHQICITSQEILDKHLHFINAKEI